MQFECALTNGLANSTSNYTACNSPMTYSDLPDGGYHFYVRAQGESIADSRAFFKVLIAFFPPTPQSHRYPTATRSPLSLTSCPLSCAAAVTPSAVYIVHHNICVTDIAHRLQGHSSGLCGDVEDIISDINNCMVISWSDGQLIRPAPTEQKNPGSIPEQVTQQALWDIFA